MSDASKCYWDIADGTTSCGRTNLRYSVPRLKNCNCGVCKKPIHFWNSDMDYTEHQVTRSIKPVETDAQSGERE
jgi:hypothetical protein